ncbi:MULTISPECIES: tRNA lysidine(34) synthetase TilS [Actinotignum]|uniref:tRNA lysidine(34) synthetase TilS n=3 Tax=Actinomycetaceae TaxID=2049 RepID=UPI00254FD6BA|nr:tRNA lysidine(34) synthetase TilS [Actinotignum schaalii]MDE1536866.1 tRNA lysidine(34) synthetase TilS [Actinotignum schaalii]MDK7271827.1 tRNA lysidine(34) synthetase TilS [Actinotignum schaalii]
MAGPHPAYAAGRRRLRALLKSCGYGPGTRLTVAVSGGSDSLALARIALFVARRDGYLLRAVTVNHGIRPEAGREAAQVASLLRSWGYDDAATVSVDLGGGSSPEGQARAARYAALAAAAGAAREAAGAAGEMAGAGKAAGACGPVLLGHTADDQAETVLLGLGRGSGARSLAGMPEAGPLPGHPEITALRPLLGLRRAALRAALQDEGIAWVEDPSNEPDGPWRAAGGGPLTRAALRSRALPALQEALGPGTVEALARTAYLLRRDNEALDAWAARELSSWEEHGVVTEAGEPAGGVVVPIAPLRELPTAVRTRILRALALRAGARAGEVNAGHIEALDALVTGPGGVRHCDLPGARALRRDNIVVFAR